MLWGIKNKFNLSLKEAERVTVAAIDRDWTTVRYMPTPIWEDLIDKALNQNFVPVVDDQKNFIGIITRKDIIVITTISLRNAVRRHRPVGARERRHGWCWDRNCEKESRIGSRD